MDKLENPDSQSLEALIDKQGLSAVLHMIADICEARDARERDMWQAPNLITSWGRDCDAIAQIALGIGR